MALAMNVTMIVCSALSLVFMSLRFFSKHLVNTKLGIDDAVLLFSWVRLRHVLSLGSYPTNFSMSYLVTFCDIHCPIDLCYKVRAREAL